MEEEEILDIPLIDIPLIFNNNIDTNNVKNLLLIDSSVSESKLFFDSSNSNTFPIIYSYNSNRTELVKLLEDKFSNGLERITFVFHDNKNHGKKFLNQELLFLESDIQEDVNSCSVNTYSPNTKFLIDVSKKFGVKNIDFLACNSLNYSNWVKFYDLLAKETGVIVGASNTKTGNLKSGGNWIMENTNENIVNTYFNSNIENYTSTLSGIITQSGGIIYIQQSGNFIQYQRNSTTGTWTTFSSWPATFVNSTPASGTILTISLFNNITISNTTVGTGTNGYFITGSAYITYDGTGKTVTIDTVTAYLGLIQNGTSLLNGFSNVTVQNINNAIISSTLYTLYGTIISGSGWICQYYFGNGVSNILINNCSNSGTVVFEYTGGICGSQAGCNYGNITITNCSNSGVINGKNSGGICGAQGGFNYGNITITNCLNSGIIGGVGSGGICGYLTANNYGIALITNCSNSGTITSNIAGASGASGGICGANAGELYGNVTVTNCFNTGAISGIRVGGICGAAAGNAYGIISVTNCYNTGAISSDDSGGICGFTTGRAHGNVTITNCYNTSTIGGARGGGICGGNTSIFCDVSAFGNVTITNCYNIGDINSTQSGGICGGNSGNFINSGNIVITKCYNTGNINGNFSGGITGHWFGFNSNKECSIINCYNIGNINGSNAGGITGAEIGYNSNSTYNPKILIEKCYSLGSISNTCGGICGGTENSTYRNNPTVNIKNSYTSYTSIVNSTSQYISTTLQTSVRNAIISLLANVYTSLISSWSASAANTALLAGTTPTNLYDNNPGTVWTSIGTTSPYILSIFNNSLYATSSINNANSTYTSSVGIFNPGYNYNLISVNNAITPSNITINSTNGALTFSNLTLGSYTEKVFCSQGVVPKYSGYNFNTFTLNQVTTLTWNPGNPTFNYGTTLTAANLNAIGLPTSGIYVYYITNSNPPVIVDVNTILPTGQTSITVQYTPPGGTLAQVSKVFTVNKATPIISYTPTTPTYFYNNPITSGNLNATATLNGTTVDGTFNYTYTLNSNPSINGPALPTTILNAGTYTLTATFSATDTFNFVSPVTKTFTNLLVNKATPVLNNSPSPSYIYGTGLTQGTLNLTVSPNILGAFTFKYNNASGATISSGTILNAGTYSIYQLFTPTDSTNYTTSNRTTSLTVTQIQLNLNNSPSPVYDYGIGLTQATLNLTVSVNNIPGAFTFKYNNASGATISSGTILNAGTYSIYQLFTPTDTINYTTPNRTTPLTVLQKTPVLSNTSTPPSYIYGTGLRQGTLNLTVSPNITGAFTFRYNNASGTIIPSDTILNAGTYSIYQFFTPTDGINYTTSNLTTPLTVTQKGLTITPVNTSMTYKSSPPTFDVSYDGFVNNQGPSVLTGDYNYTIKNSNNVVIAPPFSNLSDENAGLYSIYLNTSTLSAINYSISYGSGILRINKASPSLTYSFSNPFYLYGDTFGTINVPGPSATFQSSSLPGTFVYKLNSIIGDVINNNTILGVGSYNIYAIFTATDNINFNIVDTFAPLNISIKEIILSADDASMSYGQNPPPELTFSVTGTFTGNIDFLKLIAKYTITDDLGRIIEYNNLSFTNAGKYKITLSLTNITFTDYLITIAKPNADLYINKVNLYVTPENKNMVYGSQPPTLTSIYVGFVNNENYLILTGALQYKVTDSAVPPNIIPLDDLPKKNVGTYFITIIGTSLFSINYNIIIIPSSSILSIDKSILYVSPDNKTITYGYSAPLFTSTYTGFLNGDTVSVVEGTLIYTFFDSILNPINLNNVNQLDTGIYTIILNKNNVRATNYIIRILNKTAYFSIQQKLLFIFPNNKNMVYGSDPPILTFTCEGFINGDTEQSSLTGSVIYDIYDSKYNSINYNNLEIVKVGVYNIHLFLSTLSSINYNIQISNSLALLFINKRNLTINVNSLSIVYGTTPVFTSNYVGFVNRDTPKTALKGSLSYIVTNLLLFIIPDSELPHLEVGSYFINLFQGSLTSNNYEINIGINNTSLTITKKLLQIYPDNKNILYGSIIPTLTSTYTGFIIGENPSYLTGNLLYITRDSSGHIIDINDISTKIYNAGTYTITLSIGNLGSNNYSLVIGPNTSTLIISPLTPQITYTLPIKSYNYGIGFPQENLNASVSYNGTNIINDGTITYKLNSINGSILTSSTILNAGNYTVYAIFTSNNIDYISVNTYANFTVNKITPTIIYNIPEELKTMVYGTKFSKEQFNAYLTYNNEIILPGIIVYKLKLSSQQIITTNDYPLITTKKIYAEFISNNINYNNTNTFDTINVVYSNNNNGNNNNNNNNNGNDKLKKININGVWYYFNPVTKYYIKI